MGRDLVEAYAGLGKKTEAQACFTAMNRDEALHVDLRKRAKRAATQLDEYLECDLMASLELPV